MLNKSNAIFRTKQIRQGLSIQTMISTFIIVIILSFVSSYVQIYQENLDNEKELLSDISQMGNTIKPSLMDAVYKHDELKVRIYLAKIKNSPYIAFVELTIYEPASKTGKEKIITLGSKEDLNIQNSIIKTFTIGNDINTLATLKLISDHQYLANKINNKIPLIIIINVFMAIVISISIMLLIHSIIIKPLIYLVDKNSNSSIENISETLTIPNKYEMIFRNELDDLFNSINQMRQKLSKEICNNQLTNQELKSQRDFSTTLLNSCSLIICKLDIDYKIVDINSATTLLTGFLDIEIQGKKWIDIFVEQNKRKEILKKIQNSLHCNIKNLATTDQNGNILYLEWYFVPYFEENHIKYHIAYGYDITKLKDIQTKLENANMELENRIEQRTSKLKKANEDLKQAYTELQAAQKQLIQSETMASLGSLVAGIAHEINTPLGVSVTAQSLIDDQVKELNKIADAHDIDSSKIQQSIKIITEANNILNSNLKHAAELIKSFKQVAVDSSSQSLYKFNLKENLNQTLMSLSNVIKKEHLKITVICDPSYEITSYPGALTQIYTNLIINTVNHAYEMIDTKSKVDKLIMIAIERQSSDFYKIIYQDNGTGIPDDVLPKIFEPFFTTKRGQGGSGLGTNIIYNLVIKVLLGKIKCENLQKPTHGAKFTILIPNIRENS
jgi:PAS domain S-box-containing protein